MRHHYHEMSISHPDVFVIKNLTDSIHDHYRRYYTLEFIDAKNDPSKYPLGFKVSVLLGISDDAPDNLL